MKKILCLFGLLSLVLLISCNEDCEDIACFTPPSPFTFELVGKTSGENVFTNGSFDPENIKVINLEDETEVEFQFIAENEENLLQIGEIGWETEEINYQVKISEEEIFQLYVDAERVSEDCCSYTDFNEIEIGNTEYEQDSETGVYRIFVEE